MEKIIGLEGRGAGGGVASVAIIPTVTLPAAAVVVVSGHEVIMLQILTPLPEGSAPLGEGQVVGQVVVGHGLGSFDVCILQGQGISQAPGRTLL
jgi:hypothetical protein